MFAHSQGASAPSVFSFNQDNTIRVVTDDKGDSWFCAIDVCAVLDYANPRQAVAKNCRPKGVSKRDTLTPGGAQALIYINEPNLYRLIIKSRKPEAIRFEEWVMEEVLPALRKHGRYESQEEVLGAFVLMHGSQKLAGQRYLITFSDEGNGYRAKQVPNDACVMTIKQFVKSLGDCNVVAYPNLLADLIDAVAHRVKRHMEYSRYMEQQVIDTRTRGAAL